VVGEIDTQRENNRDQKESRENLAVIFHLRRSVEKIALLFLVQRIGVAALVQLTDKRQIDEIFGFAGLAFGFGVENRLNSG
jgi:hypothetical protein